MSYKTVFLLLTITILGAGCGVKISTESTVTAVPDFFTATLPPSPIPLATQTLLPPTPLPPVAPIEGTTTTQVNVRAETSTASETLGIINSFSKVQVIGKDASGSWFQIIYPETSAGFGWVRAEYVQVDASAEIPVVGSVAGNGSGVSGLVIQKINVRNGPATSFDSLGVLNPKDVVFITGKDPSGAWMQIEYAGGYGWAALEFLQVDNVDALPVIGSTVEPTETSAAVTSSQILLALQDGDSMQAPLAIGNFSPTGARVLELSGDVSAPEGDAEDWVQFRSIRDVLEIQVICTSNTLVVGLWNNEGPIANSSVFCGEKQRLRITPNVDYFLRLAETVTNEPKYTHYTLSLEALH